MNQPTFQFDPTRFRQALALLSSRPAWENLDPPAPSDVYVPPMHVKALQPEVSVVEGMRGAGKSFWTAVLANDQLRTLVATSANSPQLAKAEVRVGFGLDLDNAQFPSASMIGGLLNNGCSPDTVWRSVLLRHALKTVDIALPFLDDVQAAASWVQQCRVQADQLLVQADRELAARGKTLLVLFDSLDRLADDNNWDSVRERLTAALRLGLECRSRRAMRCKFFLRPDMIEEDDRIWRFTDSSKLLHEKVELAWRPNDLFGLVFLNLANASDIGADFRNAVTAGWPRATWLENNDVFTLPPELTAEEQPTRGIVEALAGPWVGPTAKRGFTYKWIPSHLADAKGRLSPRIVLLAFKEAAEWTCNHRPDHKLALHYEGVQQGVVRASATRVDEMKEDYPWVGPLLAAMKGATVPLDMNELDGFWTADCLGTALEKAQSEGRLPPRRYGGDSVGKGLLSALVDDLVELAVLYRTEDQRINMPDIFRVGFGIKRKGGVKPPRA